MKILKTSIAMLLLWGFAFQPANGEPLLVLGRHAALKNTIVVSKGQTALESGANLKDALASVTGTADNPYLIRVEPGVYDLGGSILTMKPYVDIQGSGQGITKISSHVSGTIGVVNGSSSAALSDLAVVNSDDGDYFCRGVQNEEVTSAVIRNVTVEVSAGCRFPYGVYNRSADATLTGVTVRVNGYRDSHGIFIRDSTVRMKDIGVEAETTGADYRVDGIRIDSESQVRMESVRAVARNGEKAYGMFVQNSAVDASRIDCLAADADYNYGVEIQGQSSVATLSNSAAAAQGGFYGYGILVYGSAPVFSNVSAKSSGASVQDTGLRATNATSALEIVIDHCRLEGGDYSLYNNSGNYTFSIGATKLDGPVLATGTWHCAFCYDGDNLALDGSCQ